MEQQRTVESLWLADGYCVCGRGIKRNTDKLCLAQVNSSWTKLRGAENTLAIGIYCDECALIINTTLRGLKKLPEPDKLKSLQISG